VIERKYLEMLKRLQTEKPSREIEPLPGWMARRRRDRPPGAAVLAGLPLGATDGTASARSA
jgi:hypothetical protein